MPSLASTRPEHDSWDARIDESNTSNVDVLDEISKFIFTSKYAQHLPREQRRETWPEAVERIESMHLKRFKGDKLTRTQRAKVRWALAMVTAGRVLPSMRSMQFGGKAVEAHNARAYNCSVRHLDSVRAFAEIFYLLLCGCGVGIGLTRKYFSRMPDLVGERDRTGTVLTYVIQDDIEGWADSLEALLLCYMKGNPFSGRKIIFDYSKIRPAGAILKTGGGKAPGYKPLKAAHKRIKALLDVSIEDRHQTRLRSIDAYDIVMHAADAVLSGGVRRSATSVIFDKDDVDMLDAKVGNWHVENPQRARSNNSALLVRNQVSLEEFRAIVARTREWGEPGFVFAEDEDTLYNPCFEVGFVPVTKDGVCGVQFCNLTSVNGAKIATEEDFLEVVEAAAILGTLQATYTHFPYLSRTAEELTREESLLGVSITAMMENPQVLLDPVIQQRAARLVVEVNQDWAAILGVNPATRATVIKPEGTGSLALGTMANGIHAAHAHWMLRRVQMNRLDPVYRHFQSVNPELCEPSLHSANGTDDLVTFPVRVPDTAAVKADLDALTHLGYIKSTQENWVLPGTGPTNTKRVHHNVSCTVSVLEHEWASVTDYLYFNRDFFSAVALLADGSDKTYVQAPFEAVVTEEDFVRFQKLYAAFQPVDYTQMVETEDGTEMTQEVACGGGACEV